MDNKKILVYFVSFLSLSLLFSGAYYFSYKKALEDFTRAAKERNEELIMSLEERGIIIVQDDNRNEPNSDKYNKDDIQATSGNNKYIDKQIQAVDNLDEVVVEPTTRYILQTYDLVKNDRLEEELRVPSYLVGLSRQEVIDYLESYMDDLPWNEFRDGLTSYELISFSKEEIVIRKTYNSNLVEYLFFIQAIDDKIVVFYSDQKTVYDYTNMSTYRLSEEEKSKLEEGYYIKDLDELYAVLENYTS